MRQCYIVVVLLGYAHSLIECQESFLEAAERHNQGRNTATAYLKITDQTRLIVSGDLKEKHQGRKIAMESKRDTTTAGTLPQGT